MLQFLNNTSEKKNKPCRSFSSQVERIQLFPKKNPILSKIVKSPQMTVFVVRRKLNWKTFDSQVPGPRSGTDCEKVKIQFQLGAAFARIPPV